MVIKNLENKIKLVLIICSLFLTGCIIISISSIDGLHHHQYLQHLDSPDNGQ